MQIHDHSGSPNLRDAAAIAFLLDKARTALALDTSAASSCIDQALDMVAGATNAPQVDARASSGGLAPWQLRRVQSMVEDRLGDRLSIAEMAAAARLSGSHFTKAFRSSVGIPPHVYLMRRRVEGAKRLMLETDLSLSSIALACGLADQAHLSRLFRRIEGQAPSAWRRACPLAPRQASGDTSRQTSCRIAA